MLRYRRGRCAAARVLLRETKFYAVGVVRPGLRVIVEDDDFSVRPGLVVRPPDIFSG